MLFLENMKVKLSNENCVDQNYLLHWRVRKMLHQNYKYECESKMGTAIENVPITHNLSASLLVRQRLTSGGLQESTLQKETSSGDNYQLGQKSTWTIFNLDDN